MTKRLNTAESIINWLKAADELGTAREVVSRQLKRFEPKRWVTLGRGHMELTNRIALEKLASSYN